MKKNIINFNSIGSRHGKYERYFPNGQLWQKTTFSNGEWHGEYEKYLPDGSLQRRCNYDMGLKIGIEETSSQ